MEQRVNQNTKVSEKENCLYNLEQQMNQPRDLADLWGRAVDLFSLSGGKWHRGGVVAIVVGVIVCALVMHFFFSAERWIRF